MSANFTPERGDYTKLEPFRFWCQKVLPLVYDDSLSYYELLCKVVDYLNKTMEDVDTLETDVSNIYAAYDELQEYVNDYFDNLSVQTEINNKLDAMAASGALSALIQPYVPPAVTTWLSAHVTQETGYVLDDSLTIADAAADAKAVGQALSRVDSMLDFYWEDVVDLTDVDDYHLHGLDVLVDANRGSLTIDGTAIANTSIYVSPAFTGVSKVRLRGGVDQEGVFIGVYTGGTYGTRVAYTTSSDDRVVNLTAANNYRIAVTIMNGTVCDDLVVIPQCLTTGMVETLLVDVAALQAEVVKKLVLKWHSGVAWLTVADNKLIIDTRLFRMINISTGLVSSAKTDTETLTLDSTSLHYVLFDGTNFSVSTTFDKTAIAFTDTREVFPLVDGLVCNYRRIQTGYIRSGSHYHVNFDRIPWPDVKMQYTDSDYKIGNNAYVLGSARSTYIRINNTDVALTITENSASLTNKKILMIGDSFVARGWIQNYLSEFEESLEFIGTHNTQYYGFKSEGVSGTRLYYFTEAATSPFAYEGGLSLAYYLTTNDLDVPDYVVINSAVNHTRFQTQDHGTYMENLLALVNMVKTYNTTYNTNIKIYVTFGPNYAMGPSCTASYPSTSRWNEIRKCCNSVYALEGVVVIPLDQVLIDEWDYPADDITYLENTIPVITDNVHPTEESGFYKLAEMIYNYLGV